MHDYIFFYGTLRKMETNYSRIANNFDIEYLGQFKTEDTYSFIGLHSGSFPYATKYTFENFEKVPIIGDLYKINKNKEEFLTNIDMLEYNYRRETTTIYENGKQIISYIYLLSDIELLKEIESNIYPKGRNRFLYIESGDWVDWKKKKMSQNQI
jgi:gamma-glutamylcyclotransferase (GGCT)/AIG2-like uncharacterized protein YtfP